MTLAKHTLLRSGALAALGLVIAACSSGGSGLTTGSLIAKPRTDEPTERALMVAATSARAARCGYNFEPARLRTAYLAYESTQGTTAEQIARLEKAYDFTRASVIEKMGPAEDYCNDERTAEIKRELTRHLAGDFKLAPRKAEVPFWTSRRADEKFDPGKVFNPLTK